MKVWRPNVCMYAYVSACVFVCVCMYVCMHARTCMRVCSLWPAYFRHVHIQDILIPWTIRGFKIKKKKKVRIALDGSRVSTDHYELQYTAFGGDYDKTFNRNSVNSFGWTMQTDTEEYTLAAGIKICIYDSSIMYPWLVHIALGHSRFIKRKASSQLPSWDRRPVV